jgi:hypothetical protein
LNCIMTDMQYSDVVAKLQDDTETEIDIRYTPTNSYITSFLGVSIFLNVVVSVYGLDGGSANQSQAILFPSRIYTFIIKKLT